jgi:hypothetical protein
MKNAREYNQRCIEKHLALERRTGGFMRKYLKFNVKDLCILQFLLEGYEGLATISVISSHGHVLISVPFDFLEDANQIISSWKDHYEFAELNTIWIPHEAKIMKKITGLMFMFITLPVIMGMSPLSGDSSPERIPIPERKYVVTFIDQMDMRTECTNASLDGGIYLRGKIGNGNHAISFKDIDYILFQLRDEKLFASVRLVTGDTVEILVNKDQKAYGQTRYGTFEISVYDLKKIMIEKRPS